MPQTIKWKTWKRVEVDDKQYRKSTKFAERSLPKRNLMLIDAGWCFGYTISWCIAIRKNPNETAIQRIKRLKSGIDDVFSRQFLQCDTVPYIPEAMWDGAGFGEYLDSMCRVSGLKFDCKGAVPRPNEFSGTMRLLFRLSYGGLFYLQFAPSHDEDWHCAAVSVPGDGTAKFFDKNIGEVDFEHFRLGQFLMDYFAYLTANRYKFQNVTVYSIRTAPSPPSWRPPKGGE